MPQRTPGKILRRRRKVRIRRKLVWTCNHCGQENIPGTLENCPKCGDAREDDDPTEELRRSATRVDADYTYDGPQIVCDQCGSVNPGNAPNNKCVHCGQTLRRENASTRVYKPVDAEQGWRTQRALVDEDGYDIQEPHHHESGSVGPEDPWAASKPSIARSLQTMRASRYALHPPRKNNEARLWRLAAVLGGGACIILVLLFVLNRLNEKTVVYATVSGVSWSYSLPLERLAPVSHTHATENDSWRPPRAAYNVRHEPAIVDYEDIYDDVWVEKTCTRDEDVSYNDDDGTWVEGEDEVEYDCSEYENKVIRRDPVYGTEWRYTLDEWRATSPLSASEEDHEPRFPHFDPTPTLRASGSAVETYVATFNFVTDDDRRHTDTETYERAVWDQIVVGNHRYRVIINGFNDVVAVEGLDIDFHQTLREMGAD